MTGSLHRAAPIRFLLGVVILWTVGRGVVLAGWRAEEPPVVAPGVHRPPNRFRMVSLPAFAPLLLRSPPGPGLPYEPHATAQPLRWIKPLPAGTRPLLSRVAATPARAPYQGPSGVTAAAIATPARAPRPSRWSGSAWLLARGGGRASPLAPGGQIGGGQAGVRLLYHLDESHRLALAGRLSRTIGGPRQSEAAAGLDWQPLTVIPVHLMLERRVALDRGGRDAWTAGAAGGVYAIPVAKGWRLDAYAEAGVVGARRRDLYADGAARIARSLDLGRGRSLALGGGAWGAAQPGAARLDLGPSVVLRLPVVQRSVALALDWRQRVAGEARPGSGIAFTLASDF